LDGQDEFPKDVIFGDTYAVWPHDLEKTIKLEIGSEKWITIGGEAQKAFEGTGGLKKNSLFIGERLRLLKEDGAIPASLEQLCNRILHFAANL